MAAHLTSQTLLLAAEPESQQQVQTTDTPQQQQEKHEYPWQICWKNVLIFTYLHSTSVYSLGLIFTGHVALYTVLFGYLVIITAGMGITAGAHRLWAHRAYKAKWPLRTLLAFLQAMAFQNSIYEWVRDHRVHHKFTDTDADPHNAQRGFFFSHIGWLMVKKHKDVKEKGKTVDMSDLDSDPVVIWQRRMYYVVMPLLCFAMPTFVPYYFWNEDPWIAWNICILKYTLSLNGTWLVNSAAHFWGNRPYDQSIGPRENKTVSILAFGEGWHNYHHAFPWDYKAAELGNYDVNISAGFIDFFAKIGWAYNLRSVSSEVIRKRAARTGDGSLKDPQDPKHHMNSFWGWGDKDMTEEDKECAIIQHKLIKGE